MVLTVFALERLYFEYCLNYVYYSRVKASFQRMWLYRHHIIYQTHLQSIDPELGGIWFEILPFFQTPSGRQPRSDAHSSSHFSVALLQSWEHLSPFSVPPTALQFPPAGSDRWQFVAPTGKQQKVITRGKRILCYQLKIKTNYTNANCLLLYTHPRVHKNGQLE